MSNEQDDKLNRLLGRQGSIAERTAMAKELDDDKLQTAAPYSPQAKEELERRRLAKKRWFERPVGIIVLGVLTLLVFWAVQRFFEFG